MLKHLTLKKERQPTWKRFHLSPILSPLETVEFGLQCEIQMQTLFFSVKKTVLVLSRLRSYI